MASAGDEGFDRSAAVTRSLLGWGVVAGVFYLVVGVAQGILRDGFSFADHALSLLMLGDYGWIQAGNLVLTGAMVLAAALGFQRAMKPDVRASRAGVLLGIFAIGLIGSGIFPPDPVDGFPDANSTSEATFVGILHLAFAGVGFMALAAAAFVVAGWPRAGMVAGVPGRLTGGAILVCFVAGAALATTTVGVILLWIAVVVGWAWLAAASVVVYRIVPHPDLHVREAAGARGE